ncbi:MAG TPA: mechanosensitive ion channel domain-containing protein [Cellvibrionaceae bacterium]
MTGFTVKALFAFRVFVTVCALGAIFSVPTALAQLPDDDMPANSGSVTDNNTEDQRIKAHIENIYAVLEPLADVEVEVKNGVVLLSGTVSNQVQAERALALAAQIPGAVTVDDGIERRLDVQGNLSPMLAKIKSDLTQWTRALPLVALALLVFALIVYLGHRLARWSSLWHRLTPNPFVAELAAQAVRVFALIIGIVVTLNLLGATALMAAILGGAGIAGLAIGFAVRDTMENYISSIMLSLRQPFRANDHVVINDYEGKVVRLTSRATVLMTLDGNQLRIPNTLVFKGVILNYSRNPERGFKFELGVGSADNAVSAMKVGLDAMKSLPFVLTEPPPYAIIGAIGDSNIGLIFTGWIDQRQTDFGRARSLAIQAVTGTLDQKGFSMPEPIYRLRFDTPLGDALPGQTTIEETPTLSKIQNKHTAANKPNPVEIIDVSPDTHIDGMVKDERDRALHDDKDLLDERRPVE